MDTGDTHTRKASIGTSTYGLLDDYAAMSSQDEYDAQDEEDMDLNSQIHAAMTSFHSFKSLVSSNMSTPLKSSENKRDSNQSGSSFYENNDKYGFRKSNNFVSEKDFNDWFKEYNKYTIKRKNKWLKFMKKNGFTLSSSDVPTKFPPKSEEMYKFVRKGIPSEWRGKAWFYFVHGPERLKENTGLYTLLVKETYNMNNENSDAIEKDLNRTFPDNVYFQAFNDTSPMIETLRRVLKAFSIYKPKIGYCQSLNFIAGLLLLFLSEEETFWMLVIITENFLPNVHESSLEGVTINQGILLLFLKHNLPNIWKIIMQNDDDIETDDINVNSNDTSYLYFLPSLTFCTTNWFMSLFIGVVPIETTLRFWDIIFYNGPITIFQMSLGIFKILEPEITKAYCQTHGISNNKVIGQLSLHSDTDLTLAKTLSTIGNSNKEMLSGVLFQQIQNNPKKILHVDLFIEEIERSSFSNLTANDMKRCRNFVIQSRETHSAIAKRQENLGMSRKERKDLIKQHMALSMAVPTATSGQDQMHSTNTIINDTPSNASRNNNRGLKTAYWNVGLNRRIKKIYSKGE